MGARFLIFSMVFFWTSHTAQTQESKAYKIFNEYTEQIMQNCDFTKQFPSYVFEQISGSESIQICSDFKNKIKFYTKRIKPFNVQGNCKKQALYPRGICEENLLRCRKALFEVRGIMEFCRLSIKNSTRYDSRYKK